MPTKSASRNRCPAALLARPRSSCCPPAEGVKFVRAGIILRNLSPAADQQAFGRFHLPHEGQEISTLIETINTKYWRGFVGLAHAGMRQGPSWQVKRNNVSPRVTTQSDELATAKAA